MSHPAQFSILERSRLALIQAGDRLTPPEPWRAQAKRWLTHLRHPPDTLELEVHHKNQLLAVSSVSLGTAVAGIALVQPWLSLTGMLLALYTFGPTFRGALHTLQNERRIDNQVLDATRLLLCLALRYDFILTLNALLQATSQKFFTQSQAEFNKEIEALEWVAEADRETVRQILLDAAGALSLPQQRGQAAVRQMAPWMLASFVLTIPWLGVNRAAAFLTTGFGAHLNTLGPFTVRKTLLAAAQQGILVKDIHVLETAAQIDTLVIDAQVLADAAARASLSAAVDALRAHRPQPPHPFSVYCLLDSDDTFLPLVDQIDCAVAVAAGSAEKRLSFLQTLQQSGRSICYIGATSQEEGEDDSALLSCTTVAWRSSAALAHSPAQVHLMEGDLTALAHFVGLASDYSRTQRFNLQTPIGFDWADIGTTVFIHLGLVYSILFNYAGLATAALYARRPQRAAQKATAAPSPAVAVPASAAVAAAQP